VKVGRDVDCGDGESGGYCHFKLELEAVWSSIGNGCGNTRSEGLE